MNERTNNNRAKWRNCRANQIGDVLSSLFSVGPYWLKNIHLEWHRFYTIFPEWGRGTETTPTLKSHDIQKYPKCKRFSAWTRCWLLQFLQCAVHRTFTEEYRHIDPRRYHIHYIMKHYSSISRYVWHSVVWHRRQLELGSDCFDHDHDNIPYICLINA